MRAFALLAGAPLLYLAAAGLLGPAVAFLPAEDGPRAAVAAVAGALAMGSLAAGLRTLPRRPALGAGLAAVAVVFAADRLLPALAGDAVRAWAILVAAGALGEAFADLVAPRLGRPSLLFSAAVCFALFDVWSVWVGPAASAVSGGLLAPLLLPVPAPGGGTFPFLGVSDLIAAALLAGIWRRRGLSTAPAWQAGAGGVTLAIGQALVLRTAAPALPWILGLFCVLVRRDLAVDGQVLARTARLSAATVVALCLATGALWLAGKIP